MEINWKKYIAANNLDGVNRVLGKYGYLPAYDEAEAEGAIEILQDEIGEKATVELLKEHPDFDIIVDIYHQDHLMPEFKKATGNEIEIIKSVQEPMPVPQLVSNIPAIDHFSVTFQNVVLVVMAFWLINKIINK